MTEICREAGTSQAAYFNWKNKYAGQLPSEVRRLRELRDENRRLNKIVNTHWFLSLADAREELEAWRRDDKRCDPMTQSRTSFRSCS